MQNYTPIFVPLIHLARLSLRSLMSPDNKWNKLLASKTNYQRGFRAIELILNKFKVAGNLRGTVWIYEDLVSRARNSGQQKFMEANLTSN